MGSFTTAHPEPRSEVRTLSRKEMSDRVKRIQDLLAQRAYELYEKSGQAEGHTSENWRRAEADIIFKIPVGLMTSANGLNVYVGTCGACARDLEICIEPRRLTIAGQVPVQSILTRRDGRAPVHVFRVIDLPLEVDPSRVNTKLSNGLLQIELAKREPEAQAA
jgi:HSP20 family molecular chaperone IbpA